MSYYQSVYHKEGNMGTSEDYNEKLKEIMAIPTEEIITLWPLARALWLLNLCFFPKNKDLIA